MENIQKDKWSYLEISLLSSVSWTPQQLHVPLFLASSSSSTKTLSLKTLRKTPLFLLSSFSFFFFLFLPSYSPANKHGFPNHPLQLHASCKRPPTLSWGSPTSTVCNFPNPLYRCRILIAPQSINLILCQPFQRRHVVSRDRATWPNNLHER